MTSVSPLRVYVYEEEALLRLARLDEYLNYTIFAFFS